ncbi:MAG: cytochrome c3 family protein [Thermoanaerobaculia bacterium]
MKRPTALELLLPTLALSASALVAQQPVEHPRLVDLESTQCSVCHDDLTDGRAQIHAPVVDDCTTCHDVSIGAEGTTVALMDSEPGLCVFCHDDKEPAVEMDLETPHMPAADSCLICHEPHAANHQRLLLAPVGELCGDCHDLEDLVQPHGGQLTPTIRCAGCHEPHGSNNPRLLRASTLHPPFEAGSCEGCHRAPFGGRIRLRARGEKLCTACHGEFEVAAGGSSHAALVGERGRAGCLSCHDPHMGDQAAVLVDSGPRLCARCHADVVEAASAQTGHAPAAEDCLSCHQPHVSGEEHLLNDDRGELCAACHDLDPAPPATPAATEIRGAGLADYGPAAVVAAAESDNGTEEPALCSQPFPEDTWGGEIVICERGGVWRNLKSRNVAAGGAGGMILANRPGGAQDLTEEPHAVPTAHIDTAGHAALQAWLERSGEHRATLAAGTLLLEPLAPPPSAGGDLVKAHLGADLRRLDCVGCHTPHGAGNAKLAARVLHPPVEDGCDSCHEGGHDQLMEGGGTDLCLFCHEDPAEDAAFPHEALELASCTDCHNPHASAQDSLVKSPGAGPCADCHDEQVAGADEVAHGAVDLLGCRACHEPHGGDREKLLRRTGPELCLSCHPSGGLQVPDGAPTFTLLDRFEIPAAVSREISALALSADGLRDHPIAGHRVLGQASEEELIAAKVETTFTGELTCLSCHDPHKGRSSRLFRWGAAASAEACQACHIK